MRDVMYIYGLICPHSHEVKYVGRTRDLCERYTEHCRGTAKATRHWVRELQSPPVLVLLDTVSCPGNLLERVANDCETKWIKRFRKTVINKRLRDNSPHTWDTLVNH